MCYKLTNGNIVQFHKTIDDPKWSNWKVTRIPDHKRREWEAKNAKHRVSPGFYRIPLG